MSNDLISGAASDFIGSLLSDFVVGILSATRRRIKRQFQSPLQQQALVESLGEALTLALRAVTLDAILTEHYQTLFSDFLQREDVQDELSILLEPRSGKSIDVELLKDAFRDAGYDSDTMSELDFDVFIMTLADRFYVAASNRPELQKVIEISLLRDTVANLQATLLQLETIRKTIDSSVQETRVVADIAGEISRTVSNYLKQKEQELERRAFETLHLILRRTIARLNYLPLWFEKLLSMDLDHVDPLEPIVIPPRLRTSAFGLWEKWKNDEIVRQIDMTFLIKFETALKEADAVFEILHHQHIVFPFINPEEEAFRLLITLREHAQDQLSPLFKEVHGKLGKEEPIKQEIADAVSEMLEADEKTALLSSELKAQEKHLAFRDQLDNYPDSTSREK